MALGLECILPWRLSPVEGAEASAPLGYRFDVWCCCYYQIIGLRSGCRLRKAVQRRAISSLFPTGVWDQWARTKQAITGVA